MNSIDHRSTPNYEDQRSEVSRQENNRMIPILPRKATPSNIRSKSSDVRDMFVYNRTEETNTLPETDELNRYGRNRVRSRQPSKENHSSRYSVKSVDHVREYMEKKRVKEILFSHIKNHSNIIEFERFIKEQKPDLNCRDDEWKTPLHQVTIWNMSTAWVNILIRHGADINRLTPQNKTALHYACENNNVTVAALLLRYKASTNVIDNEGNSPINIAIKKDNKELISLLLSTTKDIPFKSKQQRSPRSIDVFRKYSTSRKRSTKYEPSLSNRHSSNQFAQYSKKLGTQAHSSSSTGNANCMPKFLYSRDSESAHNLKEAKAPSKKISQYKQYSGMLVKNREKNKNYTINTEIKPKYLTEREEASTVSNITQDFTSQIKFSTSPKTKFTDLYKSKRVGKTHLYRENTDNLRAIDTLTPSNSLSNKEPLSITTPTAGKLGSTLMQNAKSNLSNYDIKMFNNSDSDSINKNGNELMNYLKPSSNMSPEKHSPLHEAE